MMRSLGQTLLFVTSGLGVLACDQTGGAPEGDTPGSDIEADPDPDVHLADFVYEFESRFEPSVSSVSYSGQVMRQALISGMQDHLAGLTDRLDSGAFPEPGDIEAELDFYFAFDSETSGSATVNFDRDLDTLQVTFDDLSTDKDLVGKIAGNDETGQHKDWDMDFVGWDHPDVTTPESLVRHWFSQIDDGAQAWIAGDYPLGPDGAPVPAVTVTAEGQDLGQLLQKFLIGAVAFSQGTDDYLDDDIPDKGLNASNSARDEADKPYSSLEHAWDEGFGYFGAARSYSDMTDAEIAEIGYADLDGDGVIDLTTEVCWAASANAAKRDLGADAAATTDFTADAFDGFVDGRDLIHSVDGELSASQMAELQGYRDHAVEAWEAAVAATVVHYINDVLQDMNAFGTADYSFADHAKHWSEAKGFALWFQFNPRSPLSDADFMAVHAHLGMAPVLPTASAVEIHAYREGLLATRAMLGVAYGFDAANLGDADGDNGW